MKRQPSKRRRIAWRTAVLMAVAVLTAACNLYPNKANIPANKLVAQVGEKQVTFAQWMRQLDLYRVLAPNSVDPDDPADVKLVLDNLVDQEIVLEAIKDQKYKSEEFDKDIKGELEKVRQELEKLKTRVEKDLAAVTRLQKTYKDDFYNMRLAQVYAEEHVKEVIVTEKQKRDRYDQYKKDMAKIGQKPREYRVIEEQIEMRLKADNLITKLRGDREVSREEDVIQKYLGTLTPEK